MGEAGDAALTGDLALNGDLGDRGVFAEGAVLTVPALTADRAERADGAVPAVWTGDVLVVSDGLPPGVAVGPGVVVGVGVPGWPGLGLAVAEGSGVGTSARAGPTPPRTLSPIAPETAHAAVERVIFMVAPSFRLVPAKRTPMSRPGAAHESPFTLGTWGWSVSRLVRVEAGAGSGTEEPSRWP